MWILKKSKTLLWRKKKGGGGGKTVMVNNSINFKIIFNETYLFENIARDS